MTSPSTFSTPAVKPKVHINVLRLIIIALLAVMVLWYFGVFARKPHLVMVAGESPYFELVIAGAKEAARQYDVDLTVIRAKGDAQANAIRALVGQKYDGAAISPYNPQAEAQILSDLANTNTTLVTFDSDSPVSNRLCFVGTDNYAAGRLCGQQAKQACGDTGEVLISIGNLDKENVQRRRQGVIDELLDRPFEPTHPMDAVDAPIKGDKHTIVATVLDPPTREATVDAIAKAISDHPNVKCIVALSNYSPGRVLSALEKNGKSGKIPVVGFDADKDTLTGVASGEIYSSILQDQFGCGFHAIRILAENAKGDHSGLPLFQRRTLPVEIINKENVGAIAKQLASNEGGLGGADGSQATPASASPASTAPTTSAASSGG